MGGYFPWAPWVYRPCDHVPPAGAVGAGRALVGLLPGVGPLVRGQVVRAAEHLSGASLSPRYHVVTPRLPGHTPHRCRA